MNGLFAAAVVAGLVHSIAGFLLMRRRKPGMTMLRLMAQGIGWLRPDNFEPGARAYLVVYLGSFAVLFVLVAIIASRGMPS